MPHYKWQRCVIKIATPSDIIDIVADKCGFSKGVGYIYHVGWFDSSEKALELGRAVIRGAGFASLSMYVEVNRAPK